MSKSARVSRPRRAIARWLSVPSFGLLLGLSLPTTEVIANGAPSSTCQVNSMDFINKNIDISAQKSLMRKMSRNRKSQIEATSILRAVEDGRLAGILLPPRKAAAERGARMSPPRGYWALIPSGKNSTCLKNPSGEAPMIVYRQKLSPAQVDKALTAAWRECGLGNVSEPCGYTVVNKPKPKPKNPEVCDSDEYCIKHDLGDRCDPDMHICYWETDPVDRVCAEPACDTLSDFHECGYVKDTAIPIACHPIAPGVRCGMCGDVAKKVRDCHVENGKEYGAGQAWCYKEHNPGKAAIHGGAKCSIQVAKCLMNPVACVDLPGCGMKIIKPKTEYDRCMRDAYNRWENGKRQCDQKR